MLCGFLRHVLILVAASLTGANAIGADSYPSRPIRIVAPSTPGDAPDVIARLVAERLSPALGQQVFVENHPGAGGVVGSDFVAKAAHELLARHVSELGLRSRRSHREKLQRYRTLKRSQLKT